MNILLKHIEFLQGTITTLVNKMDSVQRSPSTIIDTSPPVKVYADNIPSKSTASAKIATLTPTVIMPTSSTPSKAVITIAPSASSTAPTTPTQSKKHFAKKQVLIVGDSMLNCIDETELRRDAFVRVQNHPGAMIVDLIAKGHAYEAEGHVLFSVSSYAEYGALSGRSVDDMIAGARVEVAPYKRDPMDFVLWKPSSADQPGWDSPWGNGRPGWHIECSAMAYDLLGASFDIHGGGNDLTFPHHENEIAQSKCAGHDFANVWMHNEMLQVEGKKMSKSLGNFFTVRDLLDDGVSGGVIRLVMLSTHYRKPMDWTETKRKEAEKTLTEWLSVLQKHGYSPKTVEMLKASGDWIADPELMGVLGNDLNTPGALARLHVMAKGRTAKALAPFAHGLETLGLVSDWNLLDLSAPQGDDLPDWVAPVVDRLLEQRGAARVAKDWSEADRVRDLLNAAGVQVTDIAGAASWLPGPTFDPNVLEALK